jgi:hypothetical protein
VVSVVVQDGDGGFRQTEWSMFIAQREYMRGSWMVEMQSYVYASQHMVDIHDAEQSSIQMNAGFLHNSMIESSGNIPVGYWLVVTPIVRSFVPPGL